MTLNYEQLVASPEQTVRALLDYCDLEWDPGGLDFHRTARHVPTGSEVRRPLYDSAVSHYRPYGQWLTDLRDGIDGNIR